MNQTNSTQYAQPTSTDTTTGQASGSSIFWALASLAINAMLQPSFFGYVCTGESFEGSLWPHRSSPFVCLVDLAAEIGYRKTAIDTTLSNDRNRSPSTSAITLQLVIFFLGVLPQAVKLFGMRGILGTQLMAAAFSISSLPSLMSFVRRYSADDRIASYAKEVSRSRSIELVYAVLIILGIIPSIITIFIHHESGSGSLNIPLSQDASNLCEWTRAVAVSGMLILPLASVFWLYKVIKPTCLILPTAFWFIVGSTGIMSEKKSAQDRRNLFVNKFNLLLLLGILSFMLAYLLYGFATLIGSRRSHEAATDCAANSPSTDGESESVETPADGIQPQPTRTYINTGTQTSLSSRAEQEHNEPIDSADSPSQVPAGPATRTHKPEPEKVDLPPWMDLAFYWMVQILPIDSLEDVPPETKDKGTQTESDSPTAVAEAPSPATKQEEQHSYVYYIIIVPIMYTAKWYGPLHLATLSLGKRSKHLDEEAGRPAKEPQPSRSAWKTALLYVPWFLLKIMSAVYQQYSILGDTLTAMKDMYDGEVKWIAFGISNVVSAAVYYLVLFDGK